MTSNREKKNIEQAEAARNHRSFDLNTVTAPGWVGGFEASNEAFSYPDPDLSSIEAAGNLDNIDKLQRQMRVVWPEFSWQTTNGDENSRCFVMFAPDISRLGYTDEGKVYSIICPQQGIYLDMFGSINVEITVTRNKGWVNEENPDDTRLAAQLGVEGTIWFSESAGRFPLIRLLVKKAEEKFANYQFPFTKENAIKVTTHKVGDPEQALFDIRGGLSDRFTPPEFTIHDEAFQRMNISVEIGSVVPSGDKDVDDFNQFIVDIFNLGSGNMLQKSTILTWNIWTDNPQTVDVEEWREHAEKWRISLDADHGSPGGKGSKFRFADASLFSAGKHAFEELEAIIWRSHHFIKTGKLKKKAPTSHLKKRLGKKNVNFLQD